MKKEKLSINDIATKLKISKTTVSFILNGKAKEKRISEELTNKVLRHIEKVGYKPNQFAQSLRTGKTKIIGLMVEDIADPFFASIARYMEDIAYQQGYKIIYCSTENNSKRAREFLSMFQHLGVDGYIITPPDGIEDDLRRLASKGKEIILFDRHINNLAANAVIVNNEASTYSGTQHLISQGYKKLAFVTLNSQQSQMKGRLLGFERAVQENSLSKKFIYKLPYSVDHEKYVDKIKTILQKERSIEAMLFATSYLGVGGLEAMTQLNIKIPDEMAVVSFDDTDLFRIHKPSVTAISQPLEELARTLINTLLNDMTDDTETGKRTKQTIVLPTDLIIRPSSCRPVYAN